MYSMVFPGNTSVKFEKFQLLFQYCNTFATESETVKIRVGFIRTIQPAITYSNLTIETLEQGVKYVQS